MREEDEYSRARENAETHVRSPDFSPFIDLMVLNSFLHPLSPSTSLLPLLSLTFQGQRWREEQLKYLAELYDPLRELEPGKVKVRDF